MRSQQIPTKCGSVVFGIQEVFIIQEVTRYGKGTCFVYSNIFVLSVDACSLSMNLKGEKKCVTWIATKSTKLHYYKVTWYFDKLNDVYTNSSTVGETF